MNNQNREAQNNKLNGILIILITFILLFVEYYCFVFEVLLKSITPTNFYFILVFLVIFHLLILFLLLAFFSTMCINPGGIPPNWEYPNEGQRKRYCLICKVFKPERSHHCSVCKICILNMDHHCPWVNNCIGFYNRKYFIQLLLFTSLLTIFVDIIEFYFEYNNVLIKRRAIKVSFCFVIICYILNFIVSIIITKNLIYNIKLILINSTTTESIDTGFKSIYEKYNLTRLENWEQVFGKNEFFWFFPIPIQKGRPDGDGLTWRTNEKKQN